MILPPTVCEATSHNSLTQEWNASFTYIGSSSSVGIKCSSFRCGISKVNTRNWKPVYVAQVTASKKLIKEIWSQLFTYDFQNKICPHLGNWYIEHSDKMSLKRAHIERTLSRTPWPVLSDRKIPNSRQYLVMKLNVTSEPRYMSKVNAPFQRIATRQGLISRRDETQFVQVLISLVKFVWKPECGFDNAFWVSYIPRPYNNYVLKSCI